MSVAKIGTMFYKQFEDILYIGTISAFDYPYIKVKYDDGDAEDLRAGDTDYLNLLETTNS